MSTPPSISDILNAILGAVTTALGAIATAISDNATTIATVAVIGALVISVVAFGQKMFRGIGSLVKGIM